MPLNEFLPHYALVPGTGVKPLRWMLVLHGIFGSGGNFRTVAKALSERCPSWGFVLVDLRCHGQSQAAPPPHTVISAARDLQRLEPALNAKVSGVMGHSFGGKVALAYAGLRAGEGDPLAHVCVLDSGPGRDLTSHGKSSGMAVLGMLEGIEMPLSSRERFLDIVRSHGHAKAIAEWLAMNVRRAGDGFRLRVELPSIRALLEDYFAEDVWPVLEDRKAMRFDIVLGGRSEAVCESDKARFEALSHTDAAVHLHVLPQAGHWLHADNPEGLIHILAQALNAGADDRPAAGAAEKTNTTGDFT